jgi:hypothetical protein
MDTTQLAFLSILVGFSSLPNLRQAFSLPISSILNWRIIDTFVLPIYFIIIGLLLIFQKVTNENFIVYPIFAFLAYEGFIKKYLL